MFLSRAPVWPLNANLCRLATRFLSSLYCERSAGWSGGRHYLHAGQPSSALLAYLGAGFAIAFGIFGVAITPVFIMPLFNKYTQLKDSPLKQQVLSLAHADGIRVNDVYEVDASK